jgi:prolyl 4-hydroxylase
VTILRNLFGRPRPDRRPPREALAAEPESAKRAERVPAVPVEDRSPPAALRPAPVLAGAAVASMPFTRFPNLPGSDRALLARFGRTVGERLVQDGRARKLPALNLDIFMIADFLSPEECAQLIALIDSGAKPSTLLTGAGNDGRRSSQTCRLGSAHPLVAEVERRIGDSLGLPLSHSETVQGQRYAPGQQFKMHNDYFAGGQPYSETVAAEGGQRTWTAMVFLNRPQAGGCTNFPRAHLKVAPLPGALLAWNNNDGQGLTNPYSHHEGMLVEVGVKYILTKWFRERPWHSSAASDALRV